MPETATVPPQGEIALIGMLHGGIAMNCRVTPYETPEEWFFKQFTSQAEFDQYVREHHLVVIKQDQTS